MATETIEEGQNTADLDQFQRNMVKVEELSQRLIAALQKKETVNAALHGPNQELYAKAMKAYWHEWMTNPTKVLEHQIEYWGKSVLHFVDAQKALASGKLKAPEDPGPKDRRFSNPLWDTHPYFNFIKQQYLINAAAIEQAVEDVEDIEPV